LDFRPDEERFQQVRDIFMPGFAGSRKMNLSIVILNWNGRDHLDACFSALAAQTWQGFETIMVDNASDDESVGYVREQFPWVKVVALKENQGFPGGNRAGLEAAKGEVIVLLNNDTAPEPEWLANLVRCARDRPTAGMIASHLIDWRGEKTDSAGDGCRVTGRGFGRHRGLPATTAPISGPVFGPCGGAALYRRELIEDVGFLDRDFFLGFEDTDLAFRAQWRGWDAWFCREATVRHRMSATQGNGSEINVYHGARNHLWVCAKNLPMWMILVYSPLIAAEILAMFFLAARHGQAFAYLRGLTAGLGGLPQMWRKRRLVLAGRRRTSIDMARRLSFPKLRLVRLLRRAGEVDPESWTARNGPTKQKRNRYPCPKNDDSIVPR
jgi:GT2 family glycosyltransferase